MLIALLHGVVHPPVAPHAGHIMMRDVAVEKKIPGQLLAQTGTAFRIQIKRFRRPDDFHIHAVRFGPDDRIFHRPVLGHVPERHLVA